VQDVSCQILRSIAPDADRNTTSNVQQSEDLLKRTCIIVTSVTFVGRRMIQVITRHKGKLSWLRFNVEWSQLMIMKLHFSPNWETESIICSRHMRTSCSNISIKYVGSKMKLYFRLSNFQHWDNPHSVRF